MAAQESQARRYAPNLAGNGDVDAAIEDRQRKRSWQIEDALRLCERRGEFGAGFIELARLVYRKNDRRHEPKQAISRLAGREPGEDKAFTTYR